ASGRRRRPDRTAGAGGLSSSALSRRASERAARRRSRPGSQRVSVALQMNPPRLGPAEASGVLEPEQDELVAARKRFAEADRDRLGAFGVDADGRRARRLVE